MNRILLPLAVLLTAACNTSTKPSTGTVGSIIDADGDGFFSDVDCDDADPTVFPGADELCDDQDMEGSGHCSRSSRRRPTSTPASGSPP